MESVLTSRGITDNQGGRHNLSVRPECKVITMIKICHAFKIIVAHVFLLYLVNLTGCDVEFSRKETAKMLQF